MTPGIFIPRRWTLVVPLCPMGSQFDLFLSYILPKENFFGFQFAGVSFHFWPPKFTYIDGWTDGRMVGQAKSKKIMYLQNFSRTIRYFFLVVSWPPRRVLMTFSEKNSKKIKISKFVKKFRTTFFFQRFFSFFYQKKYISQKLFYIFS